MNELSNKVYLKQFSSLYSEHQIRELDIIIYIFSIMFANGDSICNFLV